jgi:hypothetical protein
VGTASLALFVAIEARLREWAMMPLSPYQSRNFSATNALTLLLYFALGGALYYLSFGLIRLGGYSATQAGAALLPFALIMGFGATFAGTLTDCGDRSRCSRPDQSSRACGLSIFFGRFQAAFLGLCVSADGPIGRRDGNHGSAPDVDCDGRRR